MTEEPIAIVGMACRLPASNDVEEFWNLLMEKGDAIQKVPMERWPEDQVKKVTEEERSVSGGFLKCPVDEFDGKFFGMSPKELEFTDPQQRLLLEVSWEALEDAAINPTSLKGTQTGIFTGTWTHHYEDLMNQVAFEENEFFRSYIGNAFGATAGRTFFFSILTPPVLKLIVDLMRLLSYRNGVLLRNDRVKCSNRIWLLIFNGRYRISM